MRRALLALSMFALAACAPQGLRPGERPLAANPSAVIAAELAFARLAQEKGQWTAFRATAADGAVMFVPQRVLAANWLKGRANPAASVTWQPHSVQMSCDGTAAATTGAWQGPGGAYGYFTTIWRRQKDGTFRWVLDHGAPINGTPRAAPEFIEAKVATCGPALPDATDVLFPGDDKQWGASDDTSLRWSTTVRPDGSRQVTVSRRNGDAMANVIDDPVAAPPPPVLDASDAPKAKAP